MSSMLSKPLPMLTWYLKIALFKSYCTTLYTSTLWCKYRRESLRNAYNNIFRKLTHQARDCSASHMFVSRQLPTCKILIRRNVFGFMLNVHKSNNLILNSIVHCDILFTSPLWKHWRQLSGLHNKHWPAGPPAFFSRRASDTQLLLARTGHKVFVRATHCHIMLACTIIQCAVLFPHCRDHFVINATRLTHRSEFPCYVGDIQPFTVYPTIPLVLK